jgi:hypothetical protein
MNLNENELNQSNACTQKEDITLRRGEKNSCLFATPAGCISLLR